MTKGFVLFLNLQLRRTYLICGGWFVILMETPPPQEPVLNTLSAHKFRFIFKPFCLEDNHWEIHLSIRQHVQQFYH